MDPKELFPEGHWTIEFHNWGHFIIGAILQVLLILWLCRIGWYMFKKQKPEDTSEREDPKGSRVAGEVRAQYRDETTYHQTDIKRILEEWNTDNEQCNLKRLRLSALNQDDIQQLPQES